MSAYLTPELAIQAVEMVTPAMDTAFEQVAKRYAGCLRISAKQSDGGWHLIHIMYFGIQIKWEHQYDDVAERKEAISIRTGLTSREVQTMHPELLEPGDTIYYGNAMTETIIVSFSGVEAYFDEMFTKWVLAACLALIQHQLEKQKEDGQVAYTTE